MAIGRVLLEEPNLADLLGGLLSDEEVALAPHDLEESGVGGGSGGRRLDAIEQLVVVEGQPARLGRRDRPFLPGMAASADPGRPRAPLP